MKNRTLLTKIYIIGLLASLGPVAESLFVIPVWADKNPDDYNDIEDLSKDIDNGEVDDDSVDWSDFKKSEAFKSADDEIQECIEEAEELGNNLGDYEILECVDEY
jgi:hypothetical protein